MELKDATAIITGAARGLGLEFARSILAEGGRVLLTDVDATELGSVGAQLAAVYHDRVHVQPQDVTDLTSFDTAFDTANRVFHPHEVNVLVNNAGMFRPMLQFFKEPRDASWTKLIDVNLTAVMRGTQVALHRLSSKKGQPLVVNVSSLAGVTPSAFSPEYSVTKSAVNIFTALLGKFIKRTNVRVVALCPSYADTKMGKSSGEQDAKSIQLLGGFMTTEYVAKAFVKCVNDSDNTGKALVVTPAKVHYVETALNPPPFNSKL
ncbi:hypothetical protein AC1031_017766 [Aphanomyces cochlioides]|nr:hypothetical protein AC1031_017766 [Aphanomyces cochlioides]